MRKLRGVLAIGSSLAALAIASPARAEASAWVFVGGGVVGWKPANKTASDMRSILTTGTMMFDAGVGTSPDGPVILGALFRVQPIFKNGTDMAVLARLCSRGFQAGDWGFAIDAGGFARLWDRRSFGFSGGAALGFPLGFTLTLQTEIGTGNSIAVSAIAGIDLLRLSLYRRTLLNWWTNPLSPVTPERAPTSKSASDAATFRF